MPRDEVGDDREPETGAAGVAVAAGVEADEALEDALAVGLGDAGAVVVDDEPRGAVLDAHLEVHPVRGVDERVVDEVAADLGQPHRVALDVDGALGPGAADRGVQGDVAGDGAGAHDLGLDELAEVDGLPGEREPAVVGPDSSTRSSTSRASRVVSPRRIGRSSATPCGSCGSSSSPRPCRVATGERSSWLASATKRRCVSRPRSRRASISFIVRASAATSSPVSGTGPSPRPTRPPAPRPGAG